MSTTIPDTPSLKYPKKNFGFLPPLSVIFDILFVMVFFILPLIAFAINYFTGNRMDSSEYFFNGFRLAVVLCSVVILSMLMSPKTYVERAKSQAYAKKEVIPFLNKKYGVKIPKNQAINISDNKTFMLGGQTIHFIGWRFLANGAYENDTANQKVDSMFLESLRLRKDNGEELPLKEVL